MEKWDVGILIFDGVEVLDFAGPFEVLSRTRLVPGTESRRSDESCSELGHDLDHFSEARFFNLLRLLGWLLVFLRFGISGYRES